MFQIAAAHALALRNGTSSCFDLGSCYTPMQGNAADKYRDNIFGKVNYVKVNTIRPIYVEPAFSYNELPDAKDLIIDGYFQSEKYFEDYKAEIKDLFEINHISVKGLVDNFLYQYWVLQRKTTAVHIRRGDYLKNASYHQPCSIDYYKKAMEIIGDSHFIFISDDIDWAKETFSWSNVSFSPFNNELSDLCLIANCDNVIIANSSFSWWGAWLNPNPNKVVIAPKPWFGPDGPQDTNDIIPSSWLILD